MIPQTHRFPNMDFPPTDQTTGSYRCRTRDASPTPFIHYSDNDLTYSMGVWLFVSAGWRSSSSASFLTIYDAQKADIMLRQALITQPKDLARIIDETDWEEGAYPLLRSAWHLGGALSTGPFWEQRPASFVKKLPGALLTFIGVLVFFWLLAAVEAQP